MAEVTVRKENRPSYGKYVVYTAVGTFLVSWIAVSLTRDSGGLVAVGGVVLAGIGSITVAFLMVQSLVEEWFAAAEIVDD